MSPWSKWVVVAIGLAILVPIAVRVAWRLWRGKPFRDSGKPFLMPPSGPNLGGGAGS